MAKQAFVYDSEGRQAQISGDAGAERLLLQLDDGRNVYVARGILQTDGDGNYRLPLSFAELGSASGDEAVVPVLEEDIRIRREEIDKARVLVRKTVSERKETVDETLFEERVKVERTPVNRIVEAPVPPRYEDDGTVVISLVEEVLVIEKRLMLSEEIRVSKEKHEVHKPQTVTLRKEEARVERIPFDGKKGDRKKESL